MNKKNLIDTVLSLVYTSDFCLNVTPDDFLWFGAHVSAGFCALLPICNVNPLRGADLAEDMCTKRTPITVVAPS